MLVKLTIVGCQDLRSQPTLSKSVVDGVFTIGRGSQNDWVLSDPRHVLSRHHCSIERRGDGYFVTDKSSNGTFLNNFQRRIQADETVRLHDGDRLLLGDYEFTINLLATDPSSEVRAPAFIPPVPRVPTSSQGPSPSAQDRLVSDEPVLGRTDFRRMPIEGTSKTRAKQPSQAMFGDPLRELFRSPEAQDTSEIPDEWWKSSDEKSSDEKSRDDEATPRTAPLQADAPSISSDLESEPSAQQTPVPPATESALVAAFLRGAGINQEQASITPDLMMELGKALRSALHELRDLLAARSTVKGEFGLERTALGPSRNNPLKTFPGSKTLDIDQIMEIFFTRQQGFVAPDEAVKEGFGDIKNHQFAMMAAIQAALKTVLGQFNPRSFEADIGRQTTKSKARNWDVYQSLYHEIARRADDDFQEWFGRHFARAYEGRKPDD